ncbi:MAG: alanine racemase [Pseudobacteriovorax sp.]|nr:alanine racemase [Pseudobacteriovorax sp.]
MRCWIEISRSAIEHNFKVLSGSGKDAQFMPVIKSNAYGHGLEEVANILIALQPKWLAVNYVFEACELRQLGFQGGILVVGPSSWTDYEVAASQNIDIIIGDFPSLEFWLTLAKEKRPNIHLKFDTGMGRQGFFKDDLDQLILLALPHKSNIIGFCSHFANVEDVTDQSYAKGQIDDFSEILGKLERSGVTGLKHIAASAATLIMEESHKSIVRVGISLYGYWPSQATKISYAAEKLPTMELKPALSWRTEIALIKAIKKGQHIGYGCTYQANRDLKIAVLPVGYYEGYSRIASNRGAYVLHQGNRCPVIGRICMNMMMIDITDSPLAKENDKITLIGSDEGDHLSAEQLANWTETIHYETLTCLNPKIPKKIVS